MFSDSYSPKYKLQEYIYLGVYAQKRRQTDRQTG
jgi:hypothetical protein